VTGEGPLSFFCVFRSIFRWIRVLLLPFTSTFTIIFQFCFVYWLVGPCSGQWATFQLRFPIPGLNLLLRHWWLDLTREGNKRVRCIRDLQKTLIIPFFRKQVAIVVANFVLCYQKIFLPLKFCHQYSCRFLQMIREVFD